MCRAQYNYYTARPLILIGLIPTHAGQACIAMAGADGSCTPTLATNGKQNS